MFGQRGKNCKLYKKRFNTLTKQDTQILIKNVKVFSSQRLNKVTVFSEVEEIHENKVCLILTEK
jgi:hypothetical protein